jgi:hypothetical protein
VYINVTYEGERTNVTAFFVVVPEDGGWVIKRRAIYIT